MKLYLDIETAIDENLNKELLASLRERMKVDKFGKLLEEAALNPLLNRVIAIGFAFGGEEPRCIIHKREVDTLEEFQTIMTHNLANLSPQVVTFNGSSFDIPNLQVAFAKMYMKFPLPIPHSKYNSDYYFDVRGFLTNFNQFAIGTLEEWCMRFGVSLEKQEISGGDIPMLWENGDDHSLDVIAKKNNTDIKMLRNLSKHIIGE